MSIPNYDSNTDYEIGQLVTFNEVVYSKVSSGENTLPGTDGSFWITHTQEQQQSIASRKQLVQDLEQALTDAGFYVPYVREILGITP